ncbi:hypothetical protein NIES22_64310 [Calothrix brevissima NIES-22]|nr:hypothetical protein NIES22_64310 [Calothrix brevissima NIES-22]
MSEAGGSPSTSLRAGSKGEIENITYFRRSTEIGSLIIWKYLNDFFPKNHVVSAHLVANSANNQCEN